MRKRHIVRLVLCAAMLVGISFAVRWLDRQNREGHPLIGSWQGEPLSSGIQMPLSLHLHADGTGAESSGVGNFKCVWEPVSIDGAVVRILVTHTGESYWAGEPKYIRAELIDADTIRLGDRVFNRYTPRVTR